jgi:hypothetical protein
MSAKLLDKSVLSLIFFNSLNLFSPKISNSLNLVGLIKEKFIHPENANKTKIKIYTTVFPFGILHHLLIKSDKNVKIVAMIIKFILESASALLAKVDVVLSNRIKSSFPRSISIL